MPSRRRALDVFGEEIVLTERMGRMDVSLSAGAECGRQIVHVVQGQIAVADDPGLVYTAIIGSCVVVCLHDPVANLGGMAHYLFPDGHSYGPKETRFGHHAITGLIQQIVDRGGDAKRLRASLYGGAKMHHGRRDIGRRNADFAIRFLAQHAIRDRVHGLGGGLYDG